MASVLKRVTGSITRPADTTAYAAGDLVANSTTAGSVTPVTFNLGVSAMILRNLTLRKTKADVTNANFRVWFLSASPTVTNGDNAIIAGDFLSTVLFEPLLIDTTALLTDGGAIGSSLFDNDMLRLPNPCYALLEARAAYTPASAEVFTLDIFGEVL